MRKRLIELLYKCEEIDHAKSVNGYDSDKSIADAADYLLANGVIVQLCKVGDLVYENYRNRIFKYVVTSIEISSPYDIVYKVRSTDSWNRFVRFIGFEEHNIGKTIFLTREEAEAALKGGAE